MNGYWFILVGVLVGLAAVALLYLITRPKESRPRGVVGWLSFGPFWPSVNRYFVQRGGFTKREIIGWFVVLLFVFVAVFVSLALKRL